MIKCNNVNKIYNNRYVIKDFTYEFKDNGFYLLFGDSGCGKTTLLNLLAGFVACDSGEIMVEGKIDYITQDTFFVDFLTVMDNLKMVSEDTEKAHYLLNKFGLEKTVEQYPSTLSGGEKQRLAIIRSILQEKKILFLDEPTAALDEENKAAVFELLKEIKQDILIICSSHDAIAKSYADEVISLHKNYEYAEECKLTVNRINPTFGTKKESRTDNVSQYVKKWFKSKKRNKIAMFFFGIFLTVAMCICTFADTPGNKEESNIEFTYKINTLILKTGKDSEVTYEYLCNNKDIAETVISYSNSVPISNKVGSDGIIKDTMGYEFNIPVIPYDKANFRMADRIKYGTYFTDTNQIILTMGEAKRINSDNPASLVGTKVNKKLAILGYVELEIVGIFDEFNRIEEKYFRAMELRPNEGWFINSEFMRPLAENEEFNMNGGRGYYLYFDSYKDMKNFYDDHCEKFKGMGAFLFMGSAIQLKGVFEGMFKILLALSICIAIFTVIFYINLVKTEIAYNNSFFSVFEYAGYDIKRVINAFIRYNVFYLLRTCVIALASAGLITVIVNILNRKYAFIEFQIFTYNVPILTGFIAGIVIISVLFMNLFLRRIRYVGWYENLIAQRDLI